MTDPARQVAEARKYLRSVSQDEQGPLEHGDTIIAALCDAVDALSARLAQAEQERDEWKAAAREANAAAEKAFAAVDEARAEVADTRSALARLREYEEALNLIATGGYGDASIKARIALVSGDTDG